MGLKIAYFSKGNIKLLKESFEKGSIFSEESDLPCGFFCEWCRKMLYGWNYIPGPILMIETFWYFCDPFVPLFIDLIFDKCLFWHFLGVNSWNIGLWKKGKKGSQKYQKFSNIELDPNSHFHTYNMFPNHTQKSPSA